MTPGSTPISRLRGIGPTSARWLHAAGIDTREQLQALGVVRAYRAVQAAGFKPSLNLLWALQGGLMDIHWNHVPASLRDQLLQDLKEQDQTSP